MRKSNQARSAVQSAPLTPSGVLVRLASNRRAIMVPQREAIGPDVRSTTCIRNGPLSDPKESAGKPPDAWEIMPILLKDRRAEGGTSYRTICTGVSSSVSASASTLGSPTVVAALGATVPGAAGVGRRADAGGGGAGSPNPSGSKDSGPCCPKAGKEMTRRRALATKRLLFDILSVNDANLIP